MSSKITLLGLKIYHNTLSKNSTSKVGLPVRGAWGQPLAINRPIVGQISHQAVTYAACRPIKDNSFLLMTVMFIKGACLSVVLFMPIHHYWKLSQMFLPHFLYHNLEH